MKWVVSSSVLQEQCSCDATSTLRSVSLQTSTSETSDYTAVFDMSSNVTGNSQYCCCSSLCTVHPLQKGPVHSDLSKQLVWHVAPKKQSSLPVVFTSLEGPQEDFLLLWREIPSTYWWVVSVIISVIPFEMQQWQKCRRLREFSRPDDRHKGNFCTPNRGASWVSVSDSSLNDKGAGVQNWHLFLFLIIKILCT